MTRPERRFLEGCRAGLIATLAMSFVMVLSYLLARRYFPEPVPLAMIANLLARLFRTATVTTWEVLVASILHLAYGTFWFGLLAVSTYRVTWWKGLVVGLGLWLIMLVFMLPLVGTPVFNLATWGWVWLATFVEHIVYGITGGAIMQRSDEFRRLPAVDMEST